MCRPLITVITYCLLCFVCSTGNYKAIKRNMESTIRYPIEFPPSYTPPASIPYPTRPTGGAATTPYPGPAAPGPTTYAYTQSPAGHSPEPEYGYGSPPPYRSPEQQHVVMVSADQQLQPLIVQHVPSYVGHIVFACIIFGVCNWFFGLIAVLLAG